MSPVISKIKVYLIKDYIELPVLPDSFQAVESTITTLNSAIHDVMGIPQLPAACSSTPRQSAISYYSKVFIFTLFINAYQSHSIPLTLVDLQ